MGKDASVRSIDLYRRFRPTGSQEKFLRSEALGRLFSSGYGSGKSMVGCREGIRWALQYPGSRGLIGRQVADELKTTTMVTFWKQMAIIGLQQDTHYTHNRSERMVTFWNGSEILYRHLEDPDALGSLELNWAFIDEGAEVNDQIYKTITSSRLRWHLPACDQTERVHDLIDQGATDEELMSVDCDCPRGIWVCTNPGASGYLRAVTLGKADGWDWIRAKPGDNPYNGPDYYAKMERDRQINGDVWMKRFYEGSWDAFEGQRFTMFDHDTHVLATEWRPTKDHKVVLGWDFGHVETFVSFMAYLPGQREPVVVFDEVVVNNVDEPTTVAAAVKDRMASYGLSARDVVQMGDPAGVASSQFSRISPIGAYAALGLGIAPCKAGKSPVDRANLLAAFLIEKRIQPDSSVWPGIVFGPNVPRTVQSVVNLRWKPSQGRAGEDPREVFLDKDKHGFDGLTYGLYLVPPPNTTPRLERKERPLAGINLSARDAFRAGGDVEEWEDLD